MITQSILKEYLSYNPDTGDLTWIKRTGPCNRVGQVAGYIRDTSGYRFIEIQGLVYRSHRLVWLYVHGVAPADEIDHINHNRSDNRLVNLRSVSHSENTRNKSLLSSNNSGCNGVSWAKDREKWRAKIYSNGKQIYLGSFDLLEDAIECRKAANIKYGYHPNHGL